MTAASQNTRNADSPSSSAKKGDTPPPFYVRSTRISCDPCRKRKLRCDRIKPCSTCTKRGIEQDCYQDDHHEPPQDVSLKRSRVEVKDGVEGDVESELANSLAKCREQINTISRLAKQSSHSLDSMLGTLPTRGGGGHSNGLHSITAIPVTSDDLVHWNDVCDYLPSIEKCEELITFYFEELSANLRITQRIIFDKNWRRLVDGPGLARTEAAIIFTAFAMSDIMIPASSPIVRHSFEDHHRWLMLLGDPISSTSPSLTTSVDNSFSKIKQLAMLSVYHLYTGRVDRLWETIGFAMRKAIIFGLFDERTKSWVGLDNLQKEYRRRLAWYMLTLERWQAFVRQLPFALPPSYVHLAEASFEPDSRLMRSTMTAAIVPNTPALLPDGRIQNRISAKKPGTVKFVHVELIAWCQEYLDQFFSMEPSVRYSRALLLDDALGRVLLDGLYNTGIEHEEMQTLRTSMMDGCVKERQFEMILWVSSVFFLRCLITRRFLMDENAPPNLRYVSLIYSQGILATIPSLTRLVKEGDIPVQTTWNANHLLAAATTFTVVILGQDHYLESQTNPHELNASLPKAGGTFPTEQMDWLADNIFNTLDCLETLVQGGNYSAKVAKQLLERLCGTQDDLRKLYKLRFNRIAGTDGDHHQQQQQQQQQRPSQSKKAKKIHKEVSPLLNGNGNGKGPDRSNSSSTVTMMQDSPLSTSSNYPASSSGTGPVDSVEPFLFVPPVSASSLLDAVLMDPTELDFLGKSNNSDLLAYLLQDSPTQ